jgi:hypothetical protein
MDDLHRSTLLILALVSSTIVVACGDNEDSPAAQSTGGDSGQDAAVDAATSGSGGHGGNASMSDGGGGTAGSDDQERCQAPLVSDPTDDCLACALEHCCAGAAGSCLSPPVRIRVDGESRCYQQFVRGCVATCFDERVDAEPTQSSWSLISECVDSCELEQEDRDFPRSTSPAGSLVECIVGSTADGTAGVDEDDAGVAECTMDGLCYDRSPCVDICFPNWR